MNGGLLTVLIVNAVVGVATLASLIATEALVQIEYNAKREQP